MGRSHRKISGETILSEEQLKDYLGTRRFESVNVHFERAVDRDLNFRQRLQAFITGRSRAGIAAGEFLDVITIFLPNYFQIKSARQLISALIIKQQKNETMANKPKKYLKQLSTWEGIAAIAGAIGIFINPEAAVEIVSGIFAIIGGIQMWKGKKEPAVEE